MFSDGKVAALGGDESFRERREQAAEAVATATPPSFTEEVWRYSPIDDLDTANYPPLTAEAGGGQSSVGANGLASDGLTEGVDATAAAVVTVVNGAVTGVDVRTDAVSVSLAEGTAVGANGAADGNADPTLLGRLVGSVMTEPTDVFAQANLAFMTAPVAVRIAPGAVLDGPILVRVTTTVGGISWFPRLVVCAGRTSEALVVEHHTSADVGALVCPVSELRAEAGAQLKHLCVQDLGPQVRQIATQYSVVERDARVAVHQVALGGGYARVRMDSQMVGPGGHGDISAVYFGDGDTVLDFRTFQRHIAPHTTSNLLFKGALDDHSRAVYTGTIVVAPDATNVDAEQTNHNLKLSPNAWSDSVPNLEIENNDVKCSHASSSGPIDPEQIFYLARLGVPPEAAQLALVRGFFADITSALPHSAVGSAVGRRIGQLLDEHGVGRNAQPVAAGS